MINKYVMPIFSRENAELLGKKGWSQDFQDDEQKDG